ncbi:MAG: ATPase, T2SS/T4P/T4SS family [Gemmatimonadota bacterium]
MADSGRAGDGGAQTRVLGQLLLTSGAVSAEELRAALTEQRWTRERLGEVLVRNGTAPEEVARGLARQLRLPYLEGPLQADPDAVGAVDVALALRARVVPLRLDQGRLIVAVDDPLNAGALDDLRFRTGRRVEPAVAAPGTIDAALAALEASATRPPQNAPAHPSETAASTAPRAGVASHPVRALSAPGVISMVERLLAGAWDAGASDVHVEPRADRLLVRARVDGELREIMHFPAAASAAVVSRLKIIAGLDISVKRRPQDGRATASVGARDIELRVSTLPTVEGEKTVLRLLDPAHAGMALGELGLPPPLRVRLDRILLRAHGSLLVTGPTGSGKTTTLYAILGSIDRERRNVVTLEDPIEYRLAGLTQVQVQPRSGLTFASALRAVLRQDPDVVMVGEMRDAETVEVGMAAALTGHLVLSTLHTNDAPSAVSRLVEMGTAPYLVAGGLAGVLAQRLVRRLCRGCRKPRTASADELAELGLPARATDVLDAVGCDACDGRGYRGRTGIFDLVAVDAAVRDAILNREGPDGVRRCARRAGAAGLASHAWQRVREGDTSLAEVAPFLVLLADESGDAGEFGETRQGAGAESPVCRSRRSIGSGARGKM